MTRRDVLTGVVALGAAVAMPAIASASQTESQEPFMVPDVMPSVLPMPSRSCHSSTPLQNGMVLVAGGFLAGRPTSNAVMLDPFTGDHVTMASMRTARARHAAVALPDGRVVVLGGFDGRITSSVELYDPATDSWRSMPPLLCARADFTAVLSGHGVLLIGGTGLNNVPQTVFYDLRARAR